MAEKLPRPTDAELEILTILWSRGPTRSARSTPLSPPASPRNTPPCSRLCRSWPKALVRRDEKQRAHLPGRAASRVDAAALAGDLLQRAFNGSAHSPGRLSPKGLKRNSRAAPPARRVRKGDAMNLLEIWVNMPAAAPSADAAHSLWEGALVALLRRRPLSAAVFESAPCGGLPGHDRSPCRLRFTFQHVLPCSESWKRLSTWRSLPPRLTSAPADRLLRDSTQRTICPGSPLLDCGSLLPNARYGD
jgi:hypothetical protein